MYNYGNYFALGDTDAVTTPSKDELEESDDGPIKIIMGELKEFSIPIES